MSTHKAGSKIFSVNREDRAWIKTSYILWFGAYGSTRLRVWAKSLEAALDIAVDWLAEHKPGLLADKEVAAEYKRLKAGGASEEAARDGAEVDTTVAGNYGNYINSSEWGLVSENMRKGRADLLSRRSGKRRKVMSRIARPSRRRKGSR